MLSKQYLREIFRIDNSIEALKLEREVVLSSTFKTTKLTDMKVESSPKTNIEDVFADFAEYADHISKQIEQLVQFKMRVSRQIDNLDNPDEQSVLRYRYTIGLDWETIFQLMKYSKAQTHKIHSNALESFWVLNKDEIMAYFGKHETK